MTDDKPKPWTSITKLELVPIGAVDALRQKLRRKTVKLQNRIQTLRSTRLRLEEAYEDLDAMRQERDSLKDAWEDSQIEVERLKAFIEGHGL